MIVELERGSNGLGLSLAGHKDRTKMAVFVCGINPNGAAYKAGNIKVGDEILEVSFFPLHLDYFITRVYGVNDSMCESSFITRRFQEKKYFSMSHESFHHQQTNIRVHDYNPLEKNIKKKGF